MPAIADRSRLNTFIVTCECASVVIEVVIDDYIADERGNHRCHNSSGTAVTSAAAAFSNSLSDAQLDTRAALTAHAGVGCVCAGRAYSTKLLPACSGANKQNETHRLAA